MNIFEHIELAEKTIERVDESGMRDIKALAKKYKTATGYFHMDLDGVTSAIAMKTYLERYGIKTIPTQIFFDASGKELFRHVGFMSKADILKKWSELGISLDGGTSTPPAAVSDDEEMQTDA